MPSGSRQCPFPFSYIRLIIIINWLTRLSINDLPAIKNVGIYIYMISCISISKVFYSFIEYYFWKVADEEKRGVTNNKLNHDMTQLMIIFVINLFPDGTVANIRIAKGHFITAYITAEWSYKKHFAVKTICNRTKTLFLSGQTGIIISAFIRLI